MANNRTKEFMKKVLLVVLSMLMCSASFAQMGGKSIFKTDIQARENKTIVDLSAKDAFDNITWGQIATPFVANDIYGNSISLQSYLDAGQCVVIDYSCTWCGPCWNMHTSGLLEQIDALDSVQVIWVEIESRNTTAQIFGPAGGSGSNDLTHGNWTVNAAGDSIEYPIIDDDAQNSCLATCASLYEGYVPTVFFITPDGYFCDLNINNTLISYTDVAGSMANIQQLMQRYPRSGQVPIVGINGPATTVKGNPTNFTANITSVDPVTSISWTFSNGDPATASTENATTTWNTTGTHQVTLTVTNTTGTTTATMDVQVIEWTWGDEMSYCGDDAYETSIGTGGAITWGVKFPASAMANRNYLRDVKAYIADAANYTVEVYQTNSGATPTTNDMIYQHTYNVSVTNQYYTFPMNTSVQLDNNKDLWVALSCSQVLFPAAGSAFCGDANGSYVYFQNAWSYVIDLNARLRYTWMIKATTSATEVTPTAIDGIENSNVTLYPNPTSNVLHIQAEGVQEVSVVDLSGRTVMTKNNTNVINMGELANGVYFVRVITNNGVASQKVVKK